VENVFNIKWQRKMLNDYFERIEFTAGKEAHFFYKFDNCCSSFHFGWSILLAQLEAIEKGE
jgi:hypothetical protein